MLCFSFFALSCSSKPEEQKYTVTYSVENQVYGNVSGTCSSGTKLKKGSSVTLTATANTGCSFGGWYEGQTLISSDAEYTFSVSKNVDLVAKFNLMQFTFGYSCEAEQGEIECSVQSGSQVDFNTALTLTATEKAGYTFDGWYSENGQTLVSSNQTYSFNMPAQDYSVQAKFFTKSYVLNVNFDDEMCDVSIVSGGKTYSSGDSILYKTDLTLTVTEKVGYDFAEIVQGETQVSNQSVYTFTMPANQYDISVIMTAEKRTVQFISQSVIISTQEIDYNTCAEMFQPTRDNHEFIGWYTDASLSKLYDFNKKVVENISLYAGWEETVRTYTVEFVDWNGKRIDAIQTVQEGDSAIEPARPTREGYEFEEWICEEGDYTCVDQNLVVKASYTIKTYSVQFYRDADMYNRYDTQFIEHGNLALIPTTILDTEENMLFDKWVDQDGIEFNFNTPIVSDMILIATYKPKPISVYEVRFYANGSLIDTQYVEQGQKPTEPSVVALTGQKFVGWDKAIDTGILENTDFTAQFETLTFTVKFVDFDQTVIDEQTVNYSQSAVEPTEPTRTGYEFIGWDKEFDSVLEDLVITAKYEVITFVATCYDGSLEVDEVFADYGKAFAVPATPTKDGYSFDGWYVDSDFTEKYDFTLTATKDVSLYAKFDEIVLETYTVKFFVDGVVISEQQIYSGKDAVSPGVPTKAGHTFLYWEGDFTNVSDDVNVSAIFTKNSYTVSFYEQDQTTLIETVVVYYNEQAVSPNAPYVQGYDFVGWSEDVSAVTEDMEVYAIYDSQVVVVYFYDDNEIIHFGYTKYQAYVSIPRTPSKMGHIFTGWYLDENCTVAFDFSTPITEELNLYAGWDQVFNAFTVYFYVDGQVYGNVQKVADGKYAIEPALPDGYTVWKVVGTNQIFDFENTPITDNISLYAE